MLLLASDVGGTFTDLACADLETGRISVEKVLSTPEDPARSVLDGTDRLLSARSEERDIHRIVHGSTLVSNMIIERRGARTALVANEGFIDSLEIGVENRYDLFDLNLERPTPLVPRRHRFAVSARLDIDGRIVKPVDPAEVEAIAERVREGGFEAVAVCLLHSYRNRDPELRIREILSRSIPTVPVSLSCEVAPEVREYPRTSTVAANAYVMPRVRRYLNDLERRFAGRGLPRRLSIMLSEGGIAPVETAATFPVRMIESGPAAGINAAALVARRIEAPSALAFDMGGTTAKLGILSSGEPHRVYRAEVARQRRFRPGSGLALIVPTVDLIEIGAGGGSIASVGADGLLSVGPRSSGAVPGPACYGRGGTEPTVTDADLVTGTLDPSSFLGGRMVLDPNAAERAIHEAIARPLGMGLQEAAAAIQQVVDENMAQAARIHAVERGFDPRRFTLIAFGGAAPGHAWRIAQILKLRQFVVPMGAGIMSAAGMLVTPPAIEIARSRGGVLDRVDLGEVDGLLDQMKAEARAVLAEAGVKAADATFEVAVECRYLGQSYEIQVALPPERMAIFGAAAIAEAFEARYRALYGRSLPGGRVEAITWRVRAQAPAELDRLTFEVRHAERATRKDRREVHFRGDGILECDVYDRYGLEPGQVMSGPCIVEERESTTLVGPGAFARVDPHLDLVVTMDH